MEYTQPLGDEPAAGNTEDEATAWSPQGLLRWAASRFGRRIALSCSFGGPGGLVLAHMVAQCALDIPVLFIDTNLLFPETYALRQAFADRYHLRFLDYAPLLTPQEQARLHGDELWKRRPDTCCHIRKVEPMQRALRQLDAWVTALRRDQASTRADVKLIEAHSAAGRIIWKINPLAHWTGAMVWGYLAEHDIPHNPLLDEGYRSLGCACCTERVSSSEAGERAGRWPGTPKTECGLHTFTRRLTRVTGE
jgi:phosphoadenosine phosphosulfate reductase